MMLLRSLVIGSVVSGLTLATVQPNLSQELPMNNSPEELSNQQKIERAQELFTEWIQLEYQIKPLRRGQVDLMQQMNELGYIDFDGNISDEFTGPHILHAATAIAPPEQPVRPQIPDPYAFIDELSQGERIELGKAYLQLHKTIMAQIEARKFANKDTRLFNQERPRTTVMFMELGGLTDFNPSSYAEDYPDHWFLSEVLPSRNDD